ncbi:MAG TPA: TatD family hydrolase [Clostridia bacterium]|nr:TatD family hydrolase [Clostridia bacterium]
MAARSDKPFDTHCHLNDERFADDLSKMISQVDSEMAGCICASYDFESSLKAVEIAQRSEKIFASVGMHPHSAKDMTEEVLARFPRLLENDRVVALGETGLDYYYDYSPRDVQKYWFIRQFELGIQIGMPVIIHVRDAYGDMMDILRGYKGRMPDGVMHCYSGSIEIARELLDMGFYISFAGSVTFKNADRLREVAKAIPSDRLLIETDAPYMAPVPYRGQRNCPVYVREIAETLARERGCDISELIAQTNENAFRLFRIGGGKK